MPACLPKSLASLLLEDPQFRPARLAVDDADDLCVGDKWRTGDDVSAISLDKQHLLKGELSALLAQCAVHFDDGPRRNLQLASARLDDRVHVIPLYQAQEGLHKGLSLAHWEVGDVEEGLERRVRRPPLQYPINYSRRTRVPLILWLLSVLRKLGMRRSIYSKYEESAGVLWLAL